MRDIWRALFIEHIYITCLAAIFVRHLVAPSCPPLWNCADGGFLLDKADENYRNREKGMKANHIGVKFNLGEKVWRKAEWKGIWVVNFIQTKYCLRNENRMANSGKIKSHYILSSKHYKKSWNSKAFVELRSTFVNTCQ